MADGSRPVVARRAVLNRARKCFQVRKINSEYGLFAKSDIASGRYITEIMGEVYPIGVYKNESTNDFWTLGMPKPHVRFHPAADLCVDARHMGNEARFIRRSNEPNCISRTLVLPDVLDARRDVGQAVKLVVFAQRDIARGEELTLERICRWQLPPKKIWHLESRKRKVKFTWQEFKRQKTGVNGLYLLKGRDGAM